MAHKKDTTLLSAVTSTGAGSAIISLEYSLFSFFINASSVTSGGTVDIEALSPAGDWVVISTNAISADGDTIVQKEGAFSQIRANVSARTDGTFTVSMTARGDSH